MALANTGAALQHLTPRPVKGLFGDNYLSVAEMDFTTTVPTRGIRKRS